MLFTILFQNLFLTLQFLTKIHFWGKGDVLKIRPLTEVFTLKRGFRGLTLAVLMEGTGRYLTACLMSLFINKTFISRFTSILSITHLFPPRVLLPLKLQRLKIFIWELQVKIQTTKKTPLFKHTKETFCFLSPYLFYFNIHRFSPKTDSNLILRLVIFTSR